MIKGSHNVLRHLANKVSELSFYPLGGADLYLLRLLKHNNNRSIIYLDY